MRVLVALGVALLNILAAQSVAAQGQRRPNIVIIFADDLGYGDLGAFGAPNIRTPRLDAMAAEGQKWTNFCVQPVCSPSRSALLTGRLPVRNGMFGTIAPGAPKVFRDNAAQGLPSEELTIAELLKSAGYGDVIEELDWSVGKVLDALRAAPVEPNTLVLLAAANRPPASAARSPR